VWAACSAGSLSTAHLLQPAVSMTKLLEIYYPNLTKNRIRLASGNEGERRSPAALHPKIASNLLRGPARLAGRAGHGRVCGRSPTTDGRSGGVLCPSHRPGQDVDAGHAVRRSPPCGNGSSAAGLGRSAGCWPEGGRKAPAPLACRVAMAPTGNTARRCCARQKQPVQTSCSANLTTW